MDVYDATGKRYELAPTGASGGEGAIYRITGAPLLAAKIFHARRMTQELSSKLQAMLRSVPSDASWEARRHRSIIWPVALAYRDQAHRDVAGYVMPWIDTTVFRQAHTYYDPEDRLRRFGGLYTYRHLMIAACNLSSAVAAVHAQGHRIGDLRDTNILVAPNSLVSIIDCDSFQIVDEATGRIFPSCMGTGEFLPAELQGADLGAGSIDRYHSDLYALAVLVFKFLMLGVHPSQARGPAMDDMPSIESKIKQGVYAFGGRIKGGAPPEFAPDIRILPPGLRSLADRTFILGYERPDRRPSAAEWFEALNAEGPRLKTCKRNPNHLFGGHLRSCPWCTMHADPFPPAPNIGGQIAASEPNGSASIADRSAHLKSYVEMALVDGDLSDEETRHIRKMGSTLGLRSSEVDRLIKKSRSPGTAPARTAVLAPPAAGTPSLAPSGGRPSRSLEELKGLLESHGKRGGEREVREASVLPSVVFPLTAAAIASAVPVTTAAFLVLLLVPALACASDSAAMRRSGKGWARVASKMLTRGPQAVVQSIYYLIPAVIYGGLPVAAIYWGVMGIAGIDKATAIRWLCAAATGSWLAWLLLMAPKEPFVRSVSSGRQLAQGLIRRRLGHRWALPMIVTLVIGASLWLGIQGRVWWWPLPYAPAP